jgi:hypothetical protein
MRLRQLYKILYIRLTSETPKFFKWIVKVGLLCTLLGTGLKAVDGSIPASISNVAGYVLAAGVTATVVGNFAIKDTEEVDKKLATA